MTPNEARQILGISSTDTQDEIKQAWKDLVFSFHPDRAGVGNEARKKRLEKKLKEVNMAYDILLSVQRAKKPTKTPKRPPPPGPTKLREEAMKKYNKEYQEKNKEKLKEIQKEWREKTKKRLKEYRKELKKKSKQTFP